MKKGGREHRVAFDGLVAFGPLAALDDSPRPGKEATITPEAKTWLVSLACRKAKDLGYPHELWTTRLLARHLACAPDSRAWPRMTNNVAKIPELTI